MIPVEQIVFNNQEGDCFRACIASIFELPIDAVPNFWEQTQDMYKFFDLNNKWLAEHLGYKCVTWEMKPDDVEVLNDILCVACAESPRGNVDHAVVWLNGLLHDPHPSKSGLAKDPTTFTVFIPLDPRRLINEFGSNSPDN